MIARSNAERGKTGGRTRSDRPPEGRHRPIVRRGQRLQLDQQVPECSRSWRSHVPPASKIRPRPLRQDCAEANLRCGRRASPSCRLTGGGPKESTIQAPCAAAREWSSYSESSRGTHPFRAPTIRAYTDDAAIASRDGAKEPGTRPPLPTPRGVSQGHPPEARVALNRHSPRDTASPQEQGRRSHAKARESCELPASARDYPKALHR